MGRAKTQKGCSAPIPADYEPHISAWVRVLVEAWENKVLNCNISTGEEGGRINHYWMLKNMLCNLAEGMLSNWVESRIAVHSMKAKIAEIDAQLTAMDKSFSWKGTASISSLNVHNSGGGAQGGGASGSEMGGRTITSLGGSGSAIDCSTKTPRAKPFLVPSTVEPLFK